MKKLIYLVIVLIVYLTFLNYLNNINLDIKNKKIFNVLIKNSSSLNGNIKEEKEIDIDKEKIVEVSNKIDTKKEMKKEEKIIKKDPIIYIYNTHQTEEYKNNITDHTVKPTVTVSNYLLKDYFEKENLYTYVEEDNVNKVLNKNNWKYYKSYDVTKSFMKKRKKVIPTLKYYFDIHRDSVSKDISTITIKKKKYARIMMLVGLENKNYKDNLKEAEIINNKINKSYKGLSRGIYKKQGKGVNGVYNQDFSKYVFLFEIGGQDNTLEEVSNTIEVLSKILIEYIKENESR